ncbi:MAG: dCTP deaminase, partial [Chloroflexi bacterium]|nr:dCTP deaminase [Chloroflexota bacterium]
MRLAASEIIEEIGAGKLVFDPPVDPRLIEASSVDLCLSETFYVFENVFKAQKGAGVESYLDLATYTWSKFIDQFGEKTKVPTNGHFDIPPNQLVIGFTKESVTLPQHLGGRVEGKSSNARIGLFVHISAPTIHPGFDNQISLEFYNVGPIPIRVY